MAARTDAATIFVMLLTILFKSRSVPDEFTMNSVDSELQPANTSIVAFNSVQSPRTACTGCVGSVANLNAAHATNTRVVCSLQDLKRCCTIYRAILLQRGVC